MKGRLGRDGYRREKDEWVVLVASSVHERDVWRATLQTVLARWFVLETAMRSALAAACVPATSSGAGSSGGRASSSLPPTDPLALMTLSATSSGGAAVSRE